MSNEDVRRNQSASFFKVARINEEDINKRPQRLVEETPATLSEILAEASSKATLVEETVSINPNLLTTQNYNEKISNYLEIKLNRLKDKEARFESHKDFLTRCINKGLVPKGFELMVEPTISNHGQFFIENNLKQFSLSLMKDIVQFCDKTMTETTSKIDKLKTSLKSNTN